MEAMEAIDERGPRMLALYHLLQPRGFSSASPALFE